jgi:hypothetical protein
MFDIMGGKMVSLAFGSCCHNRCILQVDDLCGFEDFCFGRSGRLAGQEVGDDGEGGKC